MWKVKIDGHITTLETLEKNFNSYIEKEEEDFFLTCPQFENLTENEIYNFAKNKLKEMLTILKLNFDFPIKAEIAYLLNSNGEKKDIVMVNTLKLGFFVTPPIIEKTDKNGVTIIDQMVLSGNLEQSLECISANRNIKLAFDYFYNYNDFNVAFNLYTILEIIREDLGKTKIYQVFNCISHSKYKQLTHTLNYGMGDRSRHYNHTHTATDNFISEEEVKHLVKEILKEWFENKCL